jgi:fatty acid desaturase
MSERSSCRAREEARRQQRAADERRMRRMFWIGLIIPAIACTVAALIIGPDSWLGWAAVIAVAPAAAAGVAITLMLQDRSKPTV